MRHGSTERVLLSGTGEGEAATTLLALARFAGQPAVVLGQQRVVGGLVGPAALREARRGMALAAGLRLPLVLVIDTAGPALSAEAEAGRAGRRDRPLPGRAGHAGYPDGVGAARSGQRRAGAGDGARRPGAGRAARLAGAAAAGGRQRDRVPRHRPCRRTAAAAQGIRSVDLLTSGIVDAIVPEHPDAADEPIEFCTRLSEAIAAELHALRGIPDAERTAARLRRYRDLGLP